MATRGLLATAVAVLLGAVASSGSLAQTTSIAAGGRPLDLSMAVSFALVRDPGFAATRADTLATSEEVPKARAGLLPSVTLTGTVTQNDLDLTAPNFVGVQTTQHFNNYPSNSYALQLRQPILRYPAWAQLSLAQAQAEGAVAQQRNERQVLAIKVAEAYFTVLLGADQIRLAEAERAAYEATLAQAERGFKGGVSTLTDVSDARARRDQANAKVIEATNALAKARRQLEARIGEPVTLIAGLDAQAVAYVPPAPASADEWVQRAWAASAEIEAAIKGVDVARADVQRQKSQHAPQVDLIAASQKAQSDTTATLNQRTRSDYVGIQFSLPIYSGGGIQASVRQALARQEKAEQLLEGQRRDVEGRVREQFDAAVQGIESVRAYEQVLRSAEESKLGTQKGVQAGTRTSVDVLNAEKSVFDARQSLAQARYVFVLSLLRLHAAAGSLTDTEIARVNTWLGGSVAVAGR